MKGWRCIACGFNTGVPLKDLPDGWACPECGIRITGMNPDGQGYEAPFDAGEFPDEDEFG